MDFQDNYQSGGFAGSNVNKNLILPTPTPSLQSFDAFVEQQENPQETPEQQELNKKTFGSKYISDLYNKIDFGDLPVKNETDFVSALLFEDGFAEMVHGLTGKKESFSTFRDQLDNEIYSDNNIYIDPDITDDSRDALARAYTNSTLKFHDPSHIFLPSHKWIRDAVASNDDGIYKNPNDPDEYVLVKDGKFRRYKDGREDNLLTNIIHPLATGAAKALGATLDLIPDLGTDLLGSGTAFEDDVTNVFSNFADEASIGKLSYDKRDISPEEFQKLGFFEKQAYGMSQFFDSETLLNWDWIKSDEGVQTISSTMELVGPGIVGAKLATKLGVVALGSRAGGLVDDVIKAAVNNSKRFSYGQQIGATTGKLLGYTLPATILESRMEALQTYETKHNLYSQETLPDGTPNPDYIADDDERKERANAAATEHFKLGIPNLLATNALEGAAMLLPFARLKAFGAIGKAAGIGLGFGMGAASGGVEELTQWGIQDYIDEKYSVAGKDLKDKNFTDGLFDSWGRAIKGFAEDPEASTSFYTGLGMGGTQALAASGAAKAQEQIYNFQNEDKRALIELSRDSGFGIFDTDERGNPTINYQKLSGAAKYNADLTANLHLTSNINFDDEVSSTDNLSILLGERYSTLIQNTLQNDTDGILRNLSKEDFINFMRNELYQEFRLSPEEYNKKNFQGIRYYDWNKINDETVDTVLNYVYESKFNTDSVNTKEDPGSLGLADSFRHDRANTGNPELDKIINSKLTGIGIGGMLTRSRLAKHLTQVDSIPEDANKSDYIDYKGTPYKINNPKNRDHINNLLKIDAKYRELFADISSYAGTELTEANKKKQDDLLKRFLEVQKYNNDKKEFAKNAVGEKVKKAEEKAASALKKAKSLTIDKIGGLFGKKKSPEALQEEQLKQQQAAEAQPVSETKPATETSPVAPGAATTTTIPETETGSGGAGLPPIPPNLPTNDGEVIEENDGNDDTTIKDPTEIDINGTKIILKEGETIEQRRLTGTPEERELITNYFRDLDGNLPDRDPNDEIDSLTEGEDYFDEFGPPVDPLDLGGDPDVNPDAEVVDDINFGNNPPPKGPTGPAGGETIVDEDADEDLVSDENTTVIVINKTPQKFVRTGTNSFTVKPNVNLGETTLSERAKNDIGNAIAYLFQDSVMETDNNETFIDLLKGEINKGTKVSFNRATNDAVFRNNQKAIEAYNLYRKGVDTLFGDNKSINLTILDPVTPDDPKGLVAIELFKSDFDKVQVHVEGAPTATTMLHEPLWFLKRIDNGFYEGSTYFATGAIGTAIKNHLDYRRKLVSEIDASESKVVSGVITNKRFSNFDYIRDLDDNGEFKSSNISNNINTNNNNLTDKASRRNDHAFLYDRDSNEIHPSKRNRSGIPIVHGKDLASFDTVAISVRNESGGTSKIKVSVNRNLVSKQNNKSIFMILDDGTGGYRAYPANKGQINNAIKRTISEVIAAIVNAKLDGAAVSPALVELNKNLPEVDQFLYKGTTTLNLQKAKNYINKFIQTHENVHEVPMNKKALFNRLPISVNATTGKVFIHKSEIRLPGTTDKKSPISYETISKEIDKAFNYSKTRRYTLPFTAALPDKNNSYNFNIPIINGDKIQNMNYEDLIREHYYSGIEVVNTGQTEKSKIGYVAERQFILNSAFGEEAQNPVVSGETTDIPVTNIKEDESIDLNTASHVITDENIITTLEDVKNTPLETFTQQEFAYWLQNNIDNLANIKRPSDAPSGFSPLISNSNSRAIYDILTARPENRIKTLLSTNEKVDYKKEAAYYEKFKNKIYNLFTNSDSNGGWFQLNFGNQKNTEKDGLRRKGYITVSKNNLDLFTNNLSDILSGLNVALQEKGYNGSFKVSTSLGRLVDSFDNIVIHGANEQEVDKALEIINDYLTKNNIENIIAQKGKDGNLKDGSKSSHTQILAESVRNKEVKNPKLEVAKKETKQEPVKSKSEVSNIKAKKADIERRRQEELNSLDDNWNNTGTIFTEKTFIGKDGKTYTIKETVWTNGSKVRIQVLDSNGKVVGEAFFDKNEDGLYSAYDFFTDIQKVGIGNAIYDFVQSNFGDIKPSGARSKDGKGFWENNKQKQIDKVNAKYDAELKALEEQPTSNQSDIEAKKADVERRNFLLSKEYKDFGWMSKQEKNDYLELQNSSKDKEDREKAYLKLRELYNKKVDKNFIDKVEKVHWVNNIESLISLLENGKTIPFEISTEGYFNESLKSGWGKGVGVKLKGDTLLASNEDLRSDNKYGSIEDKNFRKYSYGDATSMILNESSFLTHESLEFEVKGKKHQGHNEFLLKNSEIEAIVIDETNSKLTNEFRLEVENLSNRLGIPIIINAKYDAELKALEAPKAIAPVKPNIEAKKADIESMSNEEISNFLETLKTDEINFRGEKTGGKIIPREILREEVPNSMSIGDRIFNSGKKGTITKKGKANNVTIAFDNGGTLEIIPAFSGGIYSLDKIQNVINSKSTTEPESNPALAFENIIESEELTPTEETLPNLEEDNTSLADLLGDELDKVLGEEPVPTKEEIKQTPPSQFKNVFGAAKKKQDTDEDNTDFEFSLDFRDTDEILMNENVIPVSNLVFLNDLQLSIMGEISETILLKTLGVNQDGEIAAVVKDIVLNKIKALSNQFNIASKSNLGYIHENKKDVTLSDVRVLLYRTNSNGKRYHKIFAERIFNAVNDLLDIDQQKEAKLSDLDNEIQENQNRSQLNEDSNRLFNPTKKISKKEKLLYNSTVKEADPTGTGLFTTYYNYKEIKPVIINILSISNDQYYNPNTGEALEILRRAGEKNIIKDSNGNIIQDHWANALYNKLTDTKTYPAETLETMRQQVLVFNRMIEANYMQLYKEGGEYRLYSITASFNERQIRDEIIEKINELNGVLPAALQAKKVNSISAVLEAIGFDTKDLNISKLNAVGDPTYFEKAVIAEITAKPDKRGDNNKEFGNINRVARFIAEFRKTPILTTIDNSKSVGLFITPSQLGEDLAKFKSNEENKESFKHISAQSTLAFFESSKELNYAIAALAFKSGQDEKLSELTKTEYVQSAFQMFFSDRQNMRPWYITGTPADGGTNYLVQFDMKPFRQVNLELALPDEDLYLYNNLIKPDLDRMSSPFIHNDIEFIDLANYAPMRFFSTEDSFINDKIKLSDGKFAEEHYYDKLKQIRSLTKGKRAQAAKEANEFFKEEITKYLEKEANKTNLLNNLKKVIIDRREDLLSTLGDTGFFMEDAEKWKQLTKWERENDYTYGIHKSLLGSGAVNRFMSQVNLSSESKPGVIKKTLLDNVIINYMVFHNNMQYIFQGDPSQYTKGYNPQNDQRSYDSFLGNLFKRLKSNISPRDIGNDSVTAISPKGLKALRKNKFNPKNKEHVYTKTTVAHVFAKDVKIPGLNLAGIMDVMESDFTYSRFGFDPKKVSEETFNALSTKQKLDLIISTFKDPTEFFPEVKDYFKVPIADAQEFWNYRYGLDFLQEQGQITFDQKLDIIKRVESNTIQKEDYKYLGIEKPLHVGTRDITDADGNKWRVRDYIKSSAKFLYPQLVKDTEWEAIYNNMEKNEVDAITFNSGIKVGEPAESVNLFNSDGTYTDADLTDIYHLESKFKGKQLNIPTDLHTEVSHPAQPDKKIGGGLEHMELEDGTPMMKLIADQERVKSDIRRIEKENLRRKLSKSDGTLDLKKLHKMLQEELNSRGFEQNAKDVVKLMEEIDPDGNITNVLMYPLHASTSPKRFDALLASIVTKGGISKGKTPGFGIPQVASIGFKTKLEKKELKDITNEAIVAVGGWDLSKGLSHYSMGTEHNPKGHAEIIIPWIFPYPIDTFIKDGKIDLDKLPEELLEGLGYRIPNQSYSSDMVFKIVGFTTDPNSLFVPHEIAIQMGADYDIDKLYAMLPDVEPVFKVNNITSNKSELGMRLKNILKKIEVIENDALVIGNNKKQLAKLRKKLSTGDISKDATSEFKDAVENTTNTLLSDLREDVEKLEKALDKQVPDGFRKSKSPLGKANNELHALRMRMFSNQNVKKKSLEALDTGINNWFDWFNSQFKAGVDLTRRKQEYTNFVYQASKSDNARVGKDGIGVFALNGSTIKLFSTRDVKIADTFQNGRNKIQYTPMAISAGKDENGNPIIAVNNEFISSKYDILSNQQLKKIFEKGFEGKQLVTYLDENNQKQYVLLDLYQEAEQVKMYVDNLIMGNLTDEKLTGLPVILADMDTVNEMVETMQKDKKKADFSLLGDTNKNNAEVVNYGLKAVNILQSDKAKQVFDKGEKNKWDLNRILTELQIPKEQKQLILDLGKTNREEIITNLLANYSYTVEINTAKEPTINKNVDYENDGIFDEDGNFQSENTTFNVNGYLYEKDKFKHIPFGYGKIKSEDDYIGNNDWESISEREYEEALGEFESKEGNERPTQHYSNLTVPGGTNGSYIEANIETPMIIPSIQSHAQFKTDNTIGWLRADEKQNYQEEDIDNLIKIMEKSGILEINCG
jgi:hypothetical protein